MSQQKKRLTYLGSNKQFKYVYEYREPNGSITYEGHIQINKKVTKCMFPTAREAAIYVDKILIQNGKDPVNVLKRK